MHKYSIDPCSRHMCVKGYHTAVCYSEGMQNHQKKKHQKVFLVCERKNPQMQVNKTPLTWQWVRAAGCAGAGPGVCLCPGPDGWRWGWAGPELMVQAWRAAWVPARFGRRQIGMLSSGRALPLSRPWTETPTQRWKWGVASSLTPPSGGS